MSNDPDLASQLEQHRSYLVRIARLQLRDEHLADDVVQETMLAALTSSGFSGESSLKTWLTSILKHKIVDVIRKRQRRAEVPEAMADTEEDNMVEDYDSPFNQSGQWEERLAEWGDPEKALNQRQFLDVMQICLDALPPNTARVFVMREYMDLEIPEIQKELGIASAHLYVIMFRARAALRRCLEAKWFAPGSVHP